MTVCDQHEDAMAGFAVEPVQVLIWSVILDECMATGDAIGALCALVKLAGGTMTLYGEPVNEQQLRGHARAAAEEKIAAALGARRG